MKLWLCTSALAVVIFFSSCEKDQYSIPKLITIEVGVNQTSATTGGGISDDGGATILAQGVCWSTNENPTINDSITEDDAESGWFTSSIKNLEPSTTYHVRAYATNSAGTGYGSSISFTTLDEGVDAMDADGNVYITVTIGNQEWFAENLRTTRYNDGTPIPTGHALYNWNELSTGAYAVYNNDNDMLEAYGALYNWHAVITGKLCPNGWRVPSDADWSQLVKYLDPEADPNLWPESLIAGGKMKSTRTEPDELPRWDGPNIDATDEYGFSALPGGRRWQQHEDFINMGNTGFWWSRTKHQERTAWMRYLRSNSGRIIRSDNAMMEGHSVRCYRDVSDK